MLDLPILSISWAAASSFALNFSEPSETLFLRTLGGTGSSNFLLRSFCILSASSAERVMLGRTRAGWAGSRGAASVFFVGRASEPSFTWETVGAVLCWTSAVFLAACVEGCPSTRW